MPKTKRAPADKHGAVAIHCVTEVPACLSPTGQPIRVGESLTAVRAFWGNGEGHFELLNGGTVPDIFFED